MRDHLRYQVVRFLGNAPSPNEDVLAVEEALQISINGDIFTVTMRTPGNDDHLVRGILFSENIYKDKRNPQIIYAEPNGLGIPTKANVIVNKDELRSDFKNNRSLISVSSCGVCGKTEIDTLLLHEEAIQTELQISADMVYQCFQSLHKIQANFQLSGGVHASAVFDQQGRMISHAEDIGRHNAVEKAIGQLLFEEKIGLGFIMIVSGRVSYEIVHKAFHAGIPILAAVSAPSSLAVDLAKNLGMTLIAFTRENRFSIYSHPERVG